MSDISLLLRLVNGVVKNVDIASNTLVTTSIKVGGGVSNTELTKAILDRLVSLQNGSDVDATYHTHDGRYFTETELGSTGATSGADRIATNNTPSNYSPSAATVQDHLEAIDTALATAGATEFSDSLFRIKDNGDATKKIAFEASGIATATTRTITMPDADVNLGALTNANIASGAAIAYSKLNLSGSIVNADINASAAIAYSKLSLTGSVVNADIATGAAIALSKLASLTASRALVSDGSGVISVSAVTSTELGYLSGVTSAIQTQLDAKALDSVVIKKDGSVAFTGNQSMGGFKLTSLGAPTSASDAATKGYVDNALEGLKPKEAVRVATTANITLSGTQTIDGVSAVAGNRVLVKDQTLAENNGIYVVAAGAWSRATDFDSLSPIDEVNKAYVAVQEGTANAGKLFVQYGTVATLGTDAINFTFFNSISGLIGGDGVAVSGSNISVDHDGEGLQFVATQLALELDGSTLSKSASGLKVATGGITNNEVNAAAAIAYSKLNLSGAIVNADIASGAAITYSKLSLTGGIVNADINASAAIAYSKLSLTGSVVDADIATGAAIAYSKLSLTSSIVNADIAAGAAIAYSKLNLSASIVNADIASGAAIAYSKLNLTGSVVLGDLASNSVDENKLTTSVAGAGLSGGGGTALSVAYSPMVKKTFVAGESFAANTSFAVRIALTGETAGRVYAATKDASVSDKFYAIGMIEGNGAAAKIAGDNIEVVLMGTITLGSSDTAFAAGEVGQPVHLLTGGAWDAVSQISYSTNDASYRLGVVQETSKIFVGHMQLLGIN